MNQNAAENIVIISPSTACYIPGDDRDEVLCG